MRAYVQSSKLSDGLNENARDARHGFRLRGYEVLQYSVEQVYAGKFDEVLQNEKDDVIFYGGVGTVREAVRRAGRPAPPMLDLPESLRAFFGRNVWEGTMGDVRRMVQDNVGLPVHMKPRDHHKLFTGKLVREFKDLIPSAHVDGKEPVVLQGLLEFVSEWRAYVLHGEILNVGHYTGDPLLFPDRDVMEAGLVAFVDQPVACSMDWGVAKDGETWLVECNSAYSLGNYSLRCLDYTAMIEASWRELMGLEQRNYA